MAGKMFVSQCSSKLNELPLFRFTSAPKPAPDRACKRKKFRQTFDPATFTNNLMSDPRVCRGSYVMDLGPTDDSLYYPCFEMVKKDPLCQLYIKELQKCSKSKTKKTLQAITTNVGAKKFLRSSELKYHNDGKQHAFSQTDVYFEELQEELKRIVQFTQTDPLNEMDASKLGTIKQIRAKIGEDKETQIYPGELWDFSEAVTPIVENIGAAVIEQALIELMLEDELATLLDQQRVYENRKKAEMDRLTRLQERQKAVVEENTRQIQLEVENAEKAREAGQAVSIAMFAKNYLLNISSTTINEARKDGILKDSKTVSEDAVSLVKWLDNETMQSYKMRNISRTILDDIIRNAVNLR